ncbi:MAG: serine/threonine-protein phosphatase [Anaerolineales bacterium]|nr:serine/threonine-protein phosphatase [Anaerolineales bacterium]
MTAPESLSLQAAGYSQPGTIPGRADRYFTGRLATGAGMDLHLAIVVDGSGAGGLAEQITKLAIDTLLEYLKTSKSNSVVEILGRAYEVANRRIYETAQQNQNKGQVACSMAVAAVSGSRLYVANVGSCRVYLVRQGQISQLTIDHTWANARLREGVLSRDEILRSPDAGKVTRLLGLGRVVQVDLGLYLRGGAETPAQAAQAQGLPLGGQDVVVVCSDGLTHTAAGGPASAATLESILRNTHNQHANMAARQMIEEASSHKTQDSATAAVLEMPGHMLGAPAQPPAGRPRPGSASPTSGKTRSRIAGILALLFSAVFLIALAGLFVIFVLPNLLPGRSTPTATQAPATQAPASATLEPVQPSQTLLPTKKPTDTLVPSPTDTAAPSATITPETPSPTPTRTLTPTYTKEKPSVELTELMPTIEIPEEPPPPYPYP